MNPRTAPLVRIVGGLSLALLCALLGLQQDAGEWAETPAPEDASLSPVLDDASSITPAALPAPAAVPLPAPAAVYPAPASCGPSCSGVAAPVELSWGTGHVAAARVSAPAEEEAPPARGADVAIAFAQAAAQSAAPAAAPSESRWPTPPVTPTPPASGWLEPVVSALFHADPAPPTPMVTDPALPAATPPQGTGTTPTAVPLAAQPTPEAFVPSSVTSAPIDPAGAPAKRPRKPGEKATGSAPAPLAAAPVPARGGTGQGGETDPNASDPPFTEAPPIDSPGQGPGQPFIDAPGHVPAWVPPVSGPGLGPVDNNPQPGVPSPWAPLLNDPPLVDRVAAPQPRAEDLLVPNVEPAASPLQAVVAAAVAEPGSLVLLALAALGLAALQRQRASQAPQGAR